MRGRRRTLGTMTAPVVDGGVAMPARFIKHMADLIEIERQRLIHMVMAIDSYDRLLEIYEMVLHELTRECRQQRGAHRRQGES